MNSEEINMDFHTSNPVLHIKRIVYSSIRLGYQYACDYPVVLCTAILLLFLHKLCPSLFMFLLSSSPVFLLTALLLGALLTYGEPCAPVIGEETSGNQHTLSRKSKISATDCLTQEIESAAAVAYAEESFESQVVCTEERIFDSIVHDTHHDEEKATSISTDMALCAEEFSVFANSVVIVETKEQQQQQQQSLSVPSNVIVETEEQTREVDEDVELQEFEISNSESYHNEMHNRYELGEIMSSCWQPVMRQDPCSDSESASSSDASMTDIIPMLDELNASINLGAAHPSSTSFRDSLNSSSDDEYDSEEDGDLGSDQVGAKEKKNDENNSEDNSSVSYSDTEKVSDVDSLIERRREKNNLKFELDKRLMDMQAAEAIQKMEAASRFRVQVPSISTTRPKVLDPSNGSEETIELPQIPDSAPSVLLPWKKTFDIPFDQIVDRERKLQETWTPRSYFPSTQHRKHGKLYLGQSTYLQQRNDVMAEKTDLSRIDACDSRSDSDSEQTGNSGKLFGSLEAHVGEEIKVISAAVSDACVLEANCEIHQGSDEFALRSLSKEKNNSSQHSSVEADCISEANSFKCRMEQVLVQSISESVGIRQPLTVKHEEEEESSSDMLPAEYGMPTIEASSVKQLNSQFSLLGKEIPACDSSSSCGNELVVQDRRSSDEALPLENGKPIEDGHASEPTLDKDSGLEV